MNMSEGGREGGDGYKRIISTVGRMSTQSGDGWGKEERRREGGGIKGEMWGRRVG